MQSEQIGRTAWAAHAVATVEARAPKFHKAQDAFATVRNVDAWSHAFLISYCFEIAQCFNDPHPPRASTLPA